MALISCFYCSYCSNLLKIWWCKINRILSLTVGKSEVWHYLNFWVESTQVWGHTPTKGSKRRSNLSPNAPCWIYKASLFSTWPFFLRTAIECFCLSSLWTSPFLCWKNKWITYSFYSPNPWQYFSFKVFLRLTLQQFAFPYEVVCMDPRELSLNNTKDCDSVSYMCNILWKTLYKKLLSIKLSVIQRDMWVCTKKKSIPRKRRSIFKT